MNLFAAMGGAPLPLEAVPLLGGIYLILPLVILLTGLALLFHAPKFAYVALLLTGFPFLISCQWLPHTSRRIMNTCSQLKWAVGFPSACME